MFASGSFQNHAVLDTIVLTIYSDALVSVLFIYKSTWGGGGGGGGGGGVEMGWRNAFNGGNC